MTRRISAAIDTEAILRSIVIVRGHRVLLDSELASLYEVETKALTRAVRRNADRFPPDNSSTCALPGAPKKKSGPKPALF
jgi:ORF6N domain